MKNTKQPNPPSKRSFRGALKTMRNTRYCKMGFIAIGAMITQVALGSLNQAAEETSKVVLTGIPLSEIPTAPMWTTEESKSSSGQAIQIEIRFFEVPKGASGLTSEGIQIMSPEGSVAFTQRISSQSGADVLSAPTVKSRDGANALIEVGTELILPAEDANKDNIQSTKVQTGVKCHIRPRFSESGDNISTDIFAQEITFEGFLVDREGVESARFNCITVSTTASIPLGETAVLGGVFREEEVVVQDEVPILGAIPLLGRFFRSTTHETNSREFIMTFTPTLGPSGISMVKPYRK